MPLVAFVSGVMGDGQDARAGLSTFGAEVKRVADWFREKEGGLLLIDEIGRGTNPVEGAALSAAVTASLARSDHWAVHVTHYAEVLEVAGVRRYRTAGLGCGEGRSRLEGRRRGIPDGLSPDSPAGGSGDTAPGAFDRRGDGHAPGDRGGGPATDPGHAGSAAGPEVPGAGRKECRKIDDARPML